MEKIVSSGTKLDIKYWIDEILDDEQQDELYDYFMELEDDGYQITSGDIYLWDSRTGKTEPIADDPEQIEMNPIWISDHLIYYIDLRDGSLNKLLLEKH